MFGPRRSNLEARIARLERVLDQVLAQLEEIRGWLDVPDGSTEPDTPRRALAHEIPPPGSTAERRHGLAIHPRAEPAPDAEPSEPGHEPSEEPQESTEPPHGPSDSPPGPRLFETPLPRTEAPADPEPSLTSAGPARPGDPDRSSHRGILADLSGLASGGTVLGRVGIALLILSVAFFFKYSIDQGWLTEWVRLAMGVATGVILAALGFRGAARGEPLGTVLAGGGIAVFFITGFVGHQWFGLVSYPVAFGFLVAASGLGIYLALRSGRQTLAVAGLIGALATPLLLTFPAPDVLGLVGYVCLIVASVAAIYMARGWRLVLLLAAVTAWLVLSQAVRVAAGAGGTGANVASAWGVQASVLFCALVFWLVPLLRAGLRAGRPDRWPRSDAGAYRWSAHLDALSLTMPLVGILMSGWLWELSRTHLGWAFLGVALFAWAVGSAISMTADPESSAETQQLVSILLSTAGLGLVLTGDVLYLVFIAEAVALFTVGARKNSPPLMGLGALVELIVLSLFLIRMALGSRLLGGDVSALLDLTAVVGAALIGSQLRRPDARGAFFVGSYLGLLAWTARELAPLEQAQALTSLAIGLEGTGVLVAGWMTDRPFLQQMGMATLLLLVAKVLLVDLAAVEPMWRVLLLFLFALLFLVLSKFVQLRRAPGEDGLRGP